MPRTPEQNQNIKDRRRTKLLAYALKAFAANGYDHTAVDDITKPAKCSHGLFYHYFDSKESVFAALIDEVLTKESEAPVQQALELGGTKGLRLLAEYAERVSCGGARDVAVARVTLGLGSASNLDEYGRAFQRSHDMRAALERLVHEGQKEGKVIDGNPAIIALALTDLANGAFLRLSGKAGGERISADVLFGIVLKRPVGE